MVVANGEDWISGESLGAPHGDGERLATASTTGKGGGTGRERKKVAMNEEVDNEDIISQL